MKSGNTSEEEAASVVAVPDGALHEGDTPSAKAGAKPAASAAEAAAGTLTKGPYDRYVAPSMRDFTPVYRVGHELLLPVSLNGSAVRLFLLDTGAFATAISPDAARGVTKVHKDSRLEIRGVSGKVDQVFTADQVVVQFAGLRQKVDDITAFDTSELSRGAGMEVSGFLGFSTLYMLNMQIDYRDGLVKFEYDSKRGFNR